MVQHGVDLVFHLYFFLLCNISANLVACMAFVAQFSCLCLPPYCRNSGVISAQSHISFVFKDKTLVIRWSHNVTPFGFELLGSHDPSALAYWHWVTTTVGTFSVFLACLPLSHLVCLWWSTFERKIAPSWCWGNFIRNNAEKQDMVLHTYSLHHLGCWCKKITSS